jgi:hypothetical protein
LRRVETNIPLLGLTHWYSAAEVHLLGKYIFSGSGSLKVMHFPTVCFLLFPKWDAPHLDLILDWFIPNFANVFPQVMDNNEIYTLA